MNRTPGNGRRFGGGTADDPGTFQQVSSLTIRVRKMVEGLLGGVHPSMHFGASLEFAEHKKYHPGDDIRHVDWKALARTDRYFVKQQQREVILNALLVLDCSASMGYQGTRAPCSKLQYAADLTAAVATVLVRQGDSAGLLTFGSSLGPHLPAGRRPDQLFLLMRRLAETVPDTAGPTAYAEAVSGAARLARRRALILFATDLWGAPPESEAALARLAAKGHNVAILHVIDPDELDLPFSRPVCLTGMEGEGSRHINPALIREDYRAAVEQFTARWRRLCRKHGIEFISAVTNRPGGAVLSALANGSRGTPGGER